MRKTYNFNYSPRTNPFTHQLEAIRYIESRNNVSLFDEQGLGKTKMVIEALCNNMKSGILDGALIICKKHLINNWCDEIEMHSHLKYIVLRGSANEKGTKFMGFSSFYIINYESAIGEIERLKMLLSIRKMAVVLDESHKIKNPEAKVTSAILGLKDLAVKKVIITGTPIANKPIDLWAQYYFLDNGVTLGTSFTAFEKKYATDLNSLSSKAQQEAFSDLRNIIKDNSLRRLKENVLELPEKVYRDEYIELKGSQAIMYETLKNELRIEVTNLSGDLIIDNSDEYLKKLLRLAQIASNPILVDKAYRETPSKFPFLDVIVNDAINNGEKVIIWSCFVENIRILYKRYKPLGSLMLYGDIPMDRRNDIIKLFKNDENHKVLIANPAAAKEGLTLTSANNAIYLDRNFNLVDYLQSQDRIHRISQTKVCNIIKLIAKNTIDEYIDELLYKKSKIAGYIQGDTDKIQEAQYLTKTDLLNILGGANGK